MKRIIAVLLALALVVSLGVLTSCKKPTEAAGKTVSLNGYTFKLPNKQPKDIEIAVVYMNVTIPFAQFIKAGRRRRGQGVRRQGVHDRPDGAGRPSR